MRSLMPSRSMAPVESCNSVTAASRNCLTSPGAPASRSTPPTWSARCAEHLQAPRDAPLADHELDGLGEPHRPGHERGKRQADQHRLHHRVGVEKHAPRAEIARQRRGADDSFGVLCERRQRPRVRPSGRRIAPQPGTARSGAGFPRAARACPASPVLIGLMSHSVRRLTSMML